MKSCGQIKSRPVEFHAKGSRLMFGGSQGATLKTGSRRVRSACTEYIINTSNHNGVWGGDGGEDTASLSRRGSGGERVSECMYSHQYPQIRPLVGCTLLKLETFGTVMVLASPKITRALGCGEGGRGIYK
jgi:hypothetical protein